MGLGRLGKGFRTSTCNIICTDCSFRVYPRAGLSHYHTYSKSSGDGILAQVFTNKLKGKLGSSTHAPA